MIRAGQVAGLCLAATTGGNVTVTSDAKVGMFSTAAFAVSVLTVSQGSSDARADVLLRAVEHNEWLAGLPDDDAEEMLDPGNATPFVW